MTKFEKYASLFIVVCLMILVTAVCCKFSYRNGYRAGWRDCVASIQIDTTQHTDTSSYVNPEPVVIEPVATIPAGYVQVKAGTISQLRARIAELEAAAIATPADSSAALVGDTTVDIALPMERKVYQDSTYRAVVEGIQARLAEIQTFNTTTTISKVVHDTKLPDLTISPAVKAGILPGAFGASAQVTFDVWHGRWQITGGAGYGLLMLNGSRQHGWVAELGWKYNLIIK